MISGVGKLTIAVLFVLLFSIPGFSQSGPANIDKYWILRDRLRSDFMLVGAGPGKSLVAERRNGIDYPSKLIFHADETSNMGLYLGVLATEYQLLNLEGASTAATISELYFALKAINRLDETAESYFRTPGSTPQPGDLNGFFIRSDVNHNFFSANSAHFNSGNHSQMPVDGITSSLYNGNQDTIPLVESLDQVLNLLHGLALVSKFVDADHLPFQDGAINISQEAKNISNRIVTYMKSNAWKIKNPVTGVQLSNAQGGDANYLSYGFAQALCAIENEFSSSPCNTYNDNVTQANYYFFQHMKNYINCPQGYDPDTSNSTCKHCQELFKPMMLAAVGRSYYNGSSNVTSSILKAQGYGTEITLASLLYEILWNDTSNSISDTHYQNLLDLGTSEGPFNHGNCDYPSFEWSAPVRWRQLERRGASCASTEQQASCFHTFTGEYNGLDYMLLMNLYALRKGPAYYGSYGSAITSVKDDLNNRIKISPNPAINSVSISTENQGFSWHVWDVSGKIFMEGISTQTNADVDISMLNPGIYFVRIEGGKAPLTRKLIKLNPF